MLTSNSPALEHSRTDERKCFVVIDFEAVTPKGRSPMPIELAAASITDNPDIVPEVLVDELIALPDASLLTAADVRQTGITLGMLADARRPDEVLWTLLNRLSPGTRLVAHNAWFERAVMAAVPSAPEGLLRIPLLDSVRLARCALPFEGSYSLDALARVYGFPLPPDRHRALADVLLTIRVFRALLNTALESGRLASMALLDQVAGLPMGSAKATQLAFFSD